jgi:ribonuclease E
MQAAPERARVRSFNLMSNKMLIDATHPEETRVVVLRGNRVEEFDFEAADRQQLRGNIYLAKVTRVEPSLQAAFVDYGGNRHGFLAFSEIHPDYYQIPYADRQALLQEQARDEAEQAAAEAEADQAAADAEADEAAGQPEPPPEGVDGGAPSLAHEFSAESGQGDAVAVEPAEARGSEGPIAEAAPQSSIGEVVEVGERAVEDSEAPAGHLQAVEDVDAGHDEAEAVESVGAEDALEEVPERRKPRPRQYKIQEVIKRRQVLLVQVVKEERGNKGAALTTYLSLAGRYSVLMPNTARGGGISRKITNAADRKRLKSVASDLEVPEGMGVILRTAGANRTKAEIKRDFEYLMRLWENVRELTLRSTAPKLVYEEGNLIKRSIRDLYSREIDQIVVAGDDAYREAKEFMRMLMPSHARHVQLYKDDTPIFSRNGVEAQLDAMFSPQVTLKSGGYIVLNQTEALVSIDVNSGRSTREHSIEDTALNTNLEAAEEIARQLRLRDLAGLIVIDFIDMEEKRNNRSVERKLKDCLRADRARIQVGRISHFGLMEMSRQRIRTGVLESSVVPCPHCRGTGQVRSISSLALQILRSLEDTLLRHSGHHLIVRTRPEVALYVLNLKRQHLAQLESRFQLTITISGEPPENGHGFSIERAGPVAERPPREIGAPTPEIAEPEEPIAEDDVEIEAESEAPQGEARDRRRRRRRRRGNGEDRHSRQDERAAEAPSADEDEDIVAGEGEERLAADEDSDRDSRRRRRGRRGGRRRGRGREGGEEASQTARRTEDDAAEDDAAEHAAPSSPAEDEIEPADDEGQARRDFDRTDAQREAAREAHVDEFVPPSGDRHADEVEALTAAAESAAEAPAPKPPQDEPMEFRPVEDDRPKRSGWWSRKGFL